MISSNVSLSCIVNCIDGHYADDGFYTILRMTDHMIACGMVTPVSLISLAVMCYQLAYIYTTLGSMDDGDGETDRLVVTITVKAMPKVL